MLATFLAVVAVLGFLVALAVGRYAIGVKVRVDRIEDARIWEANRVWRWKEAYRHLAARVAELEDAARGCGCPWCETPARPLDPTACHVHDAALSRPRPEPPRLVFV